MGKYKLRRNKKSPLIAIVLVIVIIAVIVIMGTGYSLWSSSLKIGGTATLEKASDELEVTLTQTSNGYTTPSGFSSGGRTFFTYVSDVLEDNSLTTTIQAKKASGGGSSTKTIKLTFTIKNTSNEGYVYTNGTVTQLEASNPSSAASNVSMTTSKTTINSGSTSTITFNARVNLKKMNSQDVRYKYQISYVVNGQTKYFYYTIIIKHY